jgi:hypothetical protein
LRIVCIALLSASLALVTPLQPQAVDLSKEAALLNSSRNPTQLEAAAIAISTSGNAAAIDQLARHLSQRWFLDRLDPPGGKEIDTFHLGHVFQAVETHPTAASEALCVNVASSADFVSLPERLNLLLPALAAVRPTSQAAADVFRQTNHTGFAEVNGPLLSHNGSQRALQVLAELLADQTIDVEQRVSIAHWSLLPLRTSTDVLAMCSRVLSTPDLSGEVRTAVEESLFDYQPRRWFSVRRQQPVPPAWSSATPAARDALRSLANTTLLQPDLPPELRAAVQSTLDHLR